MDMPAGQDRFAGFRSFLANRRAVQDLGRRVPEDVAVVGFDDSSAALDCRPLLTTIRQPVEEMAAEMAEVLMAQIGTPGRLPRSVTFQPTLVIRDSA
jgi:DNA-binding LacI/PurR family transcriptional regulator